MNTRGCRMRGEHPSPKHNSLTRLSIESEIFSGKSSGIYLPHKYSSRSVELQCCFLFPTLHGEMKNIPSTWLTNIFFPEKWFSVGWILNFLLGFPLTPESVSKGWWFIVDPVCILKAIKIISRLQKHRIGVCLNNVLSMNCEKSEKKPFIKNCICIHRLSLLATKFNESSATKKLIEKSFSHRKSY